jgi:dienelactone hydrolase
MSARISLLVIGLLGGLLGLATVASAAVKSREIEYTQDGTKLHGLIAWDDAVKGPRPGVLVVHEWWGLNDHARRQAERLARAGFVGLALDMYGDGKVTTHPQDAQTFAAEAMKDPAVTAARFHAARTQLEADPHVNPKHIGAIGYCFGGGVVLAMARQGEPLGAVATFHGSLATDHPAEPGKVKAPLLVMTGTADPFVTAEQVTAFENEMKAAGANFRIIRYPGAKHSFTNPDAAKYGMPQLAYDAAADKQSWDAMLQMFHKNLK